MTLKLCHLHNVNLFRFIHLQLQPEAVHNNHNIAATFAGDESKLFVVGGEDDGKSLSELKVESGDHFIVENSLLAQ